MIRSDCDIIDHLLVIRRGIDIIRTQVAEEGIVARQRQQTVIDTVQRLLNLVRRLIEVLRHTRVLRCYVEPVLAAGEENGDTQYC